jgi:hypothetical protein
MKNIRFQRVFSLIVLFALPWLLTNATMAQLTRVELAKSIPLENLQHPYLYFNAAEKPAILKRIQTDPESRDIMAALLMEGHRLLYVPVQDPPPARLQHPRYSAGPNRWNEYTRGISDGAVKLAFLYQMTGEVKYAKKAIEFAVALCDLVDWVEQAHKFDIIYPRVWPYNVPDDRVVFTYDIFASDKAIAVATVYDWVYPVLTKWERDKLRNGLLEKAITRVRGNYDFFWWATAYRCNWSPICYSGLGITAFSLMKENPEILDVAAEAYNRMNLTFNQIGDEGGWQEGRGYYGYMMRVSVNFMDILKRLSGGKYNLFTQKKISAHPFDFPLYSLTANFADGEGSPVGPTHVLNKFAEETGNTTAAWYRQKFFGEGSTLFDILWPRSGVKAVEPEQKSALFKNNNWAILRSSFTDPASVTIACKAGYNDDPHHGHLDIGQFILTWHDIPFIRDIGRMNYDEQYFNEERWMYPYASSEGHNVLSVNGEKQIPAKLKDQPWKEGIGGDILKFETSSARDYVLMDPTHAYPGKELRKWRRNIVLDKPVTTLLLDEVESAPGASVAARFFPAVASTPARPGREARVQLSVGAECTILKDHILLTAQGHRMALIPLVLDGEFEIREGKLASMPATEEAVMNWIPYFETVTTARTQSSVVVTILVPVADAKDAEGVVKSAKISKGAGGSLEVTIQRAGTSLKWQFEKTQDGLVLKN